jgi:hypothetical protein
MLAISESVSSESLPEIEAELFCRDRVESFILGQECFLLEWFLLVIMGCEIISQYSKIFTVFGCYRGGAI